MMHQYDLIVLTADIDAEWTLRTLLEHRRDALGIRSIRYRVIRDPGRDAGVYRHAHDLLRMYIRQAAYAVVVLDCQGSGQEQRKTAQQIEADLEDRLFRNGWSTADGHARAAAIAIDPELEVWVWSRSSYVAPALGLDEIRLHQILQKVPRLPNGKPQDPKDAMLMALRTARKPHSPGIFRELAQKVEIQPGERAFDKLRSVLQSWFAA